MTFPAGVCHRDLWGYIFLQNFQPNNSIIAILYPEPLLDLYNYRKFYTGILKLKQNSIASIVYYVFLEIINSKSH